MKRRTFLLRSAWFVGGLIAWGGPGCKRDSEGARELDAGSRVEAIEPKEEPWRPVFFTDKEALILQAILMRFFPADSTVGAPDAKKANVIKYIDLQMKEPHFAELERMMRSGIDFVDRLARREKKVGFVELDAAAQDDILGRYQTGSVRGVTFPQQSFFATLHSFALEGYLVAPKYGGNRDKIAWK